jgi:hypothetical protein
MKLSHMVSDGKDGKKEVLVEIADDGTVTVIDASAVHIRIPYLAGKEDQPASVQKGMLVVAVTSGDSPGKLQVVVKDHQQAVFRDGLSRVFGIVQSEKGYIPFVSVR